MQLHQRFLSLRQFEQFTCWRQDFVQIKQSLHFMWQKTSPETNASMQRSSPSSQICTHETYRTISLDNSFYKRITPCLGQCDAAWKEDCLYYLSTGLVSSYALLLWVLLMPSICSCLNIPASNLVSQFMQVCKSGTLAAFRCTKSVQCKAPEQ